MPDAPAQHFPTRPPSRASGLSGGWCGRTERVLCKSHDPPDAGKIFVDGDASAILRGGRTSRLHATQNKPVQITSVHVQKLTRLKPIGAQRANSQNLPTGLPDSRDVHHSLVNEVATVDIFR